MAEVLKLVKAVNDNTDLRQRTLLLLSLSDADAISPSPTSDQ